MERGIYHISNVNVIRTVIALVIDQPDDLLQGAVVEGYKGIIAVDQPEDRFQAAPLEGEGNVADHVEQFIPAVLGITYYPEVEVQPLDDHIAIVQGYLALLVVVEHPLAVGFEIPFDLPIDVQIGVVHVEG